MRGLRLLVDTMCHASSLRTTTLYRQSINLLITFLILTVVFNFISLILFTPPSIHFSIINRTVFFLVLLLYGLSLLLFISIFIKGKRFISVINPSFPILRFYLILFFFFTIVFHFCVTPLNLGYKIESHLGYASFILIASFIGCFVVHYPQSKLYKKKWFSVSEYLLFQIALCAIIAELGVAVWVPFTNSPLVVDSKNARKKIQVFREKPGFCYWGFSINSLGFYDEEFCSSNEKRVVINSISDSFGLGIVPFSRNFLTIAEMNLRNTFSHNEIFINNFSVPAVGVPEYLELYKNEASRFPSDITMICIFVGNDIDELKKYRDVQNIWNFSRWRLPNIIQNIYILKVSSKKETNLSSIGQTDPSRASTSTQPAISDTTDDTPHMSESVFLKTERSRFEQICVNNSVVEENYRYFLPWLKLLKKHIKEDFLLVIIPDEFQVNDSLFSKITEHMDLSKVRRDKPQEIIAAFCHQEKIKYLDLLPALREGEKTGHCYHLRDTHWNQKGNNIAGEKIAQVLTEMIREIKSR